MALFSASNLQKSFGTDVIFSGASFEIQEGDHIGLVGVNGSGKTTLFRVLTGDLPSDGGEIYQANSAVIGYMEQHVCRDLEKSAYSEVLSVVPRSWRWNGNWRKSITGFRRKRAIWTS